jgi:hypothetical protein
MERGETRYVLTMTNQAAAGIDYVRVSIEQGREKKERNLSYCELSRITIDVDECIQCLVPCAAFSKVPLRRE